MVSKEDFGDKFINDYKKVFNNYSINQPRYGMMILHCLLGQALRHIYFRSKARKIDIRLHPLFISPSGSGKGAGYGFFCHLAQDINLDNQKLTEATDAGLAGSAGVYNERTGEHEVNEGLMKSADLISMEEGSTLFDYTSDFSKKNLTYLQIAMNPLHDASCEINKKIGSIPDAISFKPHCSFLILTYIPDKFLETLIKRGVIQRFITVIQDVTLEQRMDVVNKAIDNINISTEGKFNDEYESIKNRLNVIIRKFQKLGDYKPDEVKYRYNKSRLTQQILTAVKPQLNKDNLDSIVESVDNSLKRFEGDDWHLKYGYCFNVSDKSKEGIRQVEVELVDMIKDTTVKAQEKLAEFTHRIYEILMRLAIHHAIICLRNTVETADVIHARKIYLPIWRDTIFYIEDMLIPTVVERLKINMVIMGAVSEYNSQLKLKKHVKENVWVRRGTMLKNLQKKWDNCSYVTATKRLSKIEAKDESTSNKNKWFVVRRFGNIPYLKLIQDIKI